MLLGTSCGEDSSPLRWACGGVSSFIGVNVLDPLTAKNVQLAFVLGLNRLSRSAPSLDLRGGKIEFEPLAALENDTTASPNNGGRVIVV